MASKVTTVSVCGTKIRVNTEAWAQEYGIDPDEVRDDVKTYIANGVRDTFANLGLLAED